MSDPVCMGGALSCAELLAMLNSGMAIAGAVGVLLAVVLGAFFVRAVWS